MSGAERDRITDELTRFLIRDNPDTRVVRDHAAAPEDAAAPQGPTRRSAERRTDLLTASLIIAVAFVVLHVATPWGKTDVISGLDYAIVSGDWAAATLSAAVLVICALLLIPLPCVLLRCIRGRA